MSRKHPTGKEVMHRTRRGAIALSVVAVSMLALALAVIWAELRSPDEWDPLGDYPIQTVVNAEVHLDDVVRSVGTKCAREHVTVRGVLSWQAIDPPGANIEVGSAVGEREVGCTRLAYANPIPPDVREVIEAQHANGITAPIWRITGTETPIDGTREGVPRTWTTQNFTVLP